jgi:hypothetical protein
MHGWYAKDIFVFAVEVGSIVIPHTKGSTCRVEVFAQHQAAGFLETRSLLELQGTHRRDGLEVVETGDAHSQIVCELLNAKGLVEILTETLDGSGAVQRIYSVSTLTPESSSMINITNINSVMIKVISHKERDEIKFATRICGSARFRVVT